MYDDNDRDFGMGPLKMFKGSFSFDALAKCASESKNVILPIIFY